MKLQELIKDKYKIDLHDICSAWRWLISNEQNVLLVTIFGDLFLQDQSGGIKWLDTSSGNLIHVANDLNDFKAKLKIDDNFNNWFYGWLHREIEESGIILKENEVFGFKKMPVLGGKYDFNNLEVIDISVHFHLTGQICEQIKDLPDGTRVRIKPSK